jgi:CDP-paratose 2-epimerase
MRSRTYLITGSSGLIGSEVVTYFSNLGHKVYGIDNNQREVFFGTPGSTKWNEKRLKVKYPNFTSHDVDIRDRIKIEYLIKSIKPDAVIHAAAQPSHDLAAKIPFDDFEVNAVGTLNLLEAARKHCKESPFVYLSTNKVYGDAPNELPMVEEETRWDFTGSELEFGISESLRIDQSKHSLFGASKLAADVLVQEYGRYFGMQTCCLRGGCLTGPNHSGVELHGFLNYLIKCNINSTEYTIYGYKGKQVRDNIHAHDVATFIAQYIDSPRPGEVYNLGGGKQNSVSLMEAMAVIESITGKPTYLKYEDNPRIGDHIVYYSDIRKCRKHYPDWNITRSVTDIVKEIAESIVQKQHGLAK